MRGTTGAGSSGPYTCPHMGLHAVLAQTNEEVAVPTEPGSILVWLLILGGLFGLYLMVRRSQHRANEAYRRRQETEEELRRKDPDMRQDD